MKRYYIVILTLITVAFITSCNIVDSITGKNDDATVELYPVQVGGQWGYINKNGRIEINPQFQSAAPFYEGLAAIRESNRWKYINSRGDVVIDGNFSSISRFSEGKAAVQLDGRWGYINKKGNFVINPKYRSAFPFSNGRAFIRSVNFSEHYYIDAGDKRIQSLTLPGSVDYVEDNEFRDGRAMVRRQNLFGYIDKDGNAVVDLKYSEARPFSERLAAVRISDRWGFIDGNGDVAITPGFISVGDFGDGLAPARASSNLFGYVDKAGNFVIGEQFEVAEPFTEGRAAVFVDGRWTFIDKKGNTITSPKFDDVRPFYNGLARVTILVPVGENIQTHRGYINKSGQYVWYPTN
ncbi:MAG: WG repeat-containing protein [Rhodothermaceae bacterium]|nr:WG repeat-containing protein [Rhodothermaceae bacterium]